MRHAGAQTKRGEARIRPSRKTKTGTLAQLVQERRRASAARFCVSQSDNLRYNANAKCEWFWSFSAALNRRARSAARRRLHDACHGLAWPHAS